MKDFRKAAAKPLHTEKLTKDERRRTKDEGERRRRGLKAIEEGMVAIEIREGTGEGEAECPSVEPCRFESYAGCLCSIRIESSHDGMRTFAVSVHTAEEVAHDGACEVEDTMDLLVVACVGDVVNEEDRDGFALERVIEGSTPEDVVHLEHDTRVFHLLRILVLCVIEDG